MIGERTGMNHSRVWFFLDWWPLLFSQEWWGHIWYGVLDFLVIYRWRVPVVSRFLGCNRQPMVPRAQDPDNILTEIKNEYIILYDNYL
jgi:hypothetical protein